MPVDKAIDELIDVVPELRGDLRGPAVRKGEEHDVVTR